jgi:hypothetical protein
MGKGWGKGRGKGHGKGKAFAASEEESQPKGQHAHPEQGYPAPEYQTGDTYSQGVPPGEFGQFPECSSFSSETRMPERDYSIADQLLVLVGVHLTSF